MICHLRAAGVGLVLDARGTAVPAVVHWGADLGDLSTDALERSVQARVPAVPPSAVDTPPRLSLLPTLHEGWTGRPGIDGFVAGEAVPAGTPSTVGTPSGHPRAGARSTAAGTALPPLRLERVEQVSDRAVRLALAADGGLRVTTEVELTEQGVLRVRHTWANEGERPHVVGGLAAVLPVPGRAQEVLDLSGTWSHERRPQRHDVADGAWVRETRHGRPGHDHPYAVVVGTPGFGWRHGEVWAAHVAWSGDTAHWVERSPLGSTVLGGGELLATGELALAPGESWTTPWTVAVWSGQGLDGLSDRLHRWVRATSPVPGPRPVTLNTWEAVYFDHDLGVLTELAEVGAGLGVERFVLDDGWFRGRTDDRRALGDWWVDEQRWPDGLHPLADAVTSRSMQLGLWVEPEMVSVDSETARAHPEWLLSSGVTWRHQHVLDLALPGAYAHVLERLDALLTEYPIAYLKWDHNRDLLVGRAHGQTAALYRLLEDLRSRHPEVEVESCSSGGARVDLGILERVDRFWPSDANDPLERQGIQRWSTLLVPPEYLGSHVGASPAHTTGRATDLSFRLATALFCSAGLEWDVRELDDVGRAQVAAWTATYRELRGLLHSGTVVRADGEDPALELHGVVAADRSEAVFAHVALAAPRAAVPAPLRFPGLDPDRTYEVRVVTLGDGPRALQGAAPPWLGADWAVFSGVAPAERRQAEVPRLPGRVLADVGLAAPLLLPAQALVLHLTTP